LKKSEIWPRLFTAVAFGFSGFEIKQHIGILKHASEAQVIGLNVDSEISPVGGQKVRNLGFDALWFRNGVTYRIPKTIFSSSHA